MSSGSRSLSNVTPTTVIAVVASIYIVYSTWKNAPEWIKHPLSSKKKSDDEKDANDDLCSPIAIIGKLRELQGLVSEKNSELSVDLPWYKLHACFLSMFHLSAEIRKAHPKHRDDHYEKCGPLVTKQEAVYLRETMDYAQWAYLKSYNELLSKLASRGYELLRYDTATEPGRVGHYIALNHDEKICLIGLKGTSTFSDVLTDVVGTIHSHDLPACFMEENKEDTSGITCHEGIFTAASMVADDLQNFITNLVLPQGYRVVVVGHSLGAGTACLLGILLKSRIAALREKALLEVVAFATPAVLNYTASVACAPFTTSVVNNSDMVPRLSISNLLVLNQALLEINKRLEERGLSPNSLRKAYAYAKDLTRLDEDTLLSVQELDAMFTDIHANDSLTDAHDLYVPGRVVALFERGEGRDVREAAGQEAEVGAVVADGSMSMLRQVELTTSMVADHFCTSYFNNLDDLVRDMK